MRRRSQSAEAVPGPGVVRRGALGLLLVSVVSPLAAQPRIATQAPADAPWQVSLVAGDEPGKPLVVSGTVYDGSTPLAGASVFVYQTGADGIYGPEGNAKPRIHGYMRTDARGRYEFRTVKPGAYPGGGVPSHIHYHVARRPGDEAISEILFEGDPSITERMRRSPHFVVRPFEEGEDGVLRLTYDIRLATQ